jgi:serine/threonine protein kinase
MYCIPPKVYDPEDPRVELLTGDIRGQFILTYLIGEKIGKGSFGSVYEATDIHSSKIFVIKISKDFMVMGREIQALKAFHNSNPRDRNVVPNVLAYGMFGNVVEGQKTLYSFYVMPKYGKDIDSYFHEQGKRFSLQSIVRLGIKVLDVLEQVHNSGYVYGDLKLDNILVGHGETLPNADAENAFANVSLNLIDFGFATKFVDRDGNHLPERHIDMFQGNLIFSSVS